MLLATKQFDHFSKDDYDRYIDTNHAKVQDQGPAAWFTLESNRVCIVELDNRLYINTL